MEDFNKREVNEKVMKSHREHMVSVEKRFGQFFYILYVQVILFDFGNLSKKITSYCKKDPLGIYVNIESCVNSPSTSNNAEHKKN